MAPSVFPKSRVESILQGFPDLVNALYRIEVMTLKQRSSLIKLCQAQHIPHPTETSSLAKMMAEVPGISDGADSLIGYTSVSFLEFVSDFEDIVHSPVLSPILLDLCRTAPLSHREVREAKLAGWGKEISLMESNHPDFRVDWDVLFDEERHNDSLLPELPPNPMMSRRSRIAFEEWRYRTSSVLHFPRMTFKNMSRSTRRNWESIFGESVPQDLVPILGQTNVERRYLDTGIKVAGVLELRQRWYPSSAKPRTYFAQGGITYHASKHLQDAFSDLVNVIPYTNHRTRLHPARIRLKFGQHLRIYDLEAFTSRCFEQIAFMNSLAKFCSGWPFTFLDSREGVITRDLGEVLYEYNQIANVSAAISYERLDKTSLEQSAHNFAGGLGVYGNLMTCTAAHGHALAQICEDEDQLNVAGDDAAFAEDSSNELAADYVIGAIGKDQKEKRFSSEEAGCICLKRPLYQDGFRIEQGYRTVPPSIYNILHNIFGYLDPRYRHSEREVSYTAGRISVSKEICRFVRVCHELGPGLSVKDRRDAIRFLRNIYEVCNLPTTGAVTGIDRSKITLPYLPEDANREDSYFDSNPNAETLRRFYTGHAIIDERRVLPYMDGTVVGLSPGNTFVCNSSKYLAYLRKLGFVESRPVQHLVSGLVGLGQLEYSIFDDISPVVYEFEIVESVPVHLSL